MIILGVYYGVLMVIGIPGNMLTALVILTNSHMHTAPNMYILNLVVVDVVSLAIGKGQFSTRAEFLYFILHNGKNLNVQNLSFYQFQLSLLRP